MKEQDLDLADQQLEEEFSDEDAREEVSLSDAAIEKHYAKSSFRVIYQSNNYFLPQIKDLIKQREVINLRPEYQRRLRWTPRQKSLLIESLLLNVPIPPVFLYESDLARYEVMDGQQRLSSIYEFLTNDFPLAGLETLKMLSGKRYNALPPVLKRGLDRASISAIVLLHESQGGSGDAAEIRRYVFQRLNTGGKALNPQEIRNSLYGGSFNDLIIKLTRIPEFCDAFGIPRYVETDSKDYYENPERRKNQLYKKMGDCQLVLRFFAFQDEKKVRGSVRKMLDTTMERYQNLSEPEIENFESRFSRALQAAVQIFGDDVFTLPPSEEIKRRRVSVAVYDAVMVALDRRSYSIEELLIHKREIAAGVDRLSTDPSGKEGLMTGRANTAAAILDRVDAVVKVIDRFH